MFHLLTKEEGIAQLIDLMQSIINNPRSNKTAKNLCALNQIDKTHIDPLVDLEFEGFCIKQVVLDFGSQVNIITRLTWENIGQP